MTKKRLVNFQNGVIYDDNKAFVPILLIEEYFAQKYRELEQRVADIKPYLEEKLQFTITRIVPGSFSYGSKKILTIYGEEQKKGKLPFSGKELFKHSVVIDFKTLSVDWHMNGYWIQGDAPKAIGTDPLICDFIKYIEKFDETYGTFVLRQNTNSGFLMDLSFTAHDGLSISLSDCLSLTYCFNVPYPFDDSFMHRQYIIQKRLDKDPDICDRSFFYFRKPLTNEKTLYFDSRTLLSDGILTDDSMDKMYPCLKIDISEFKKPLKDELTQLALARSTDLSVAMQDSMLSIREMQIQKLMRAYKHIKEAMKLLGEIKGDIDYSKIDRIKVDDISKIIFKNEGRVGPNGSIEFEEFFKSNSILRMLDLSSVDLTGVDIRGIDFSNTNIHIDPQKVFNKDMTGVKAVNVKFSPFSDHFEGVILNGAVINDKEAAINLETVASYDDETVIGNDVIYIDVFKK